MEEYKVMLPEWLMKEIEFYAIPRRIDRDALIFKLMTSELYLRNDFETEAETSTLYGIVDSGSTNTNSEQHKPNLDEMVSKTVPVLYDILDKAGIPEYLRVQLADLVIELADLSEQLSGNGADAGADYR